MIGAIGRIALFLTLTLFSGEAIAQTQAIQISTLEATPRQVILNVGDNIPKLSVAAPGSPNAEWWVEPIVGTDRVYLKNGKTGSYLYATRFITNSPLKTVTSQILNVLGPPTFGVYGSQPNNCNVNNTDEFQWQLRQQTGANNYFIINYSLPTSQTYTEKINGVDQLFTGQDPNGGIVQNLVWNLAGYVPPVVKKFTVGGVTIRDGTRITLTTDGVIVFLGPVDNSNAAMVGVTQGQPSWGDYAAKNQMVFQVEIVDVVQHTVRLQTTNYQLDFCGSGNFGVPAHTTGYMTRVSYWSGLPGYTNLS